MTDHAAVIRQFVRWDAASQEDALAALAALEQELAEARLVVADLIEMKANETGELESEVDRLRRCLKREEQMGSEGVAQVRKLKVALDALQHVIDGSSMVIAKEVAEAERDKLRDELAALRKERNQRFVYQPTDGMLLRNETSVTGYRTHSQLEAEVARLREALRRLLDVDNWTNDFGSEEFQQAAAALAEDTP